VQEDFIRGVALRHGVHPYDAFRHVAASL